MPAQPYVNFLLGNVSLVTEEMAVEWYNELIGLHSDLVVQIGQLDEGSGEIAQEADELKRKLSSVRSELTKLGKEIVKFTCRLDQLTDKLNVIEQRLVSSDFEREIAVMFQRQFARLEESFKNHASVESTRNSDPNARS